MRSADLLKPLSAGAPCGEDLLQVDDPDFVDYYFNVEDRLPTSYFNLVRNELFNPRLVNLDGEMAQIDALLANTRDIRLVVLQAKFQILAGKFKEFCDSLQAIAGMVEAWPDDLHPTDATDRRNALEELNSLATIAAPLEYATLIIDRRMGELAWRAYATGAGKVTARDTETAGDAGAIIAALGSADNAKAVDTLYGQITGAQEALQRIAAATRKGAAPFAPTLTRLSDRLQDLADMVAAARTDLGGTSDAPAPPAPAEDAAPSAAASPVAVAAGGVTTVAVQTSIAGITDHRGAYRLLAAAEAYFALHEPASLALVLVTQSRLLIGRPLVEALDALLPNSASNAVISFGTGDGFGIYWNRMRDLSESSGLRDNSYYGEEQDGDPVVPDVVSRDHAGLVIKQVEDFFRQREPSSPISILLFKARNMLSKDFNDLVRELIPPDRY